jgi:hypothetical protein
MGNATLKEKVVIQAKEIINLGLEINYLIQELYKVKPDHELFLKNPKMVEKIKQTLEAQTKIKKEETNQGTQENAGSN